MLASCTGEWRVTAMHIDGHLDFVRDGRATLGVDGSTNHDVAGQIPFPVVRPLELENLTEIDMRQNTVTLGLRALPEFSMGTLADLFPQIGKLRAFNVAHKRLPSSAAPVI